MAGPVDASELAEILKGLRDSMREQNILLQTFITQQGALLNAHEGKQYQQGALLNAHEEKQSSQHSIPSHADIDDNESGSNESEAAKHVPEGLRSFIKYYQPLLKSRTAFYRANKPHPEGSSWNLMSKSLADTIEAVAPQPRNGVATNGWKYWIPVFEPKSDDLKRDEVDLYLHPHGGGRPDYVAPWELRKVGNELFHVDDVRREEPLGFTEEAIDEWATMPYSFMPPTPAGPNGEALIAMTGITVDWNDLHSCLGNLYSVPPDGRLALSFERNELRLMCASDDISPYLRQIRKMFRNLDREGGSFCVKDFDIFGHSATYSWKKEKKAKVRKEPTYWKAAGASVLAESSGLVVAPSSNGHLVDASEFKSLTGRDWFEGPDDYYNLSAEGSVIRRPRAVGFVQSRNWYRLVYCRGLASIMGSATSEKPSSLKDAEKIWSLLVYSSQQRPRQRSDRRSVIQETFNLHISCSRIQRAGNHYLSRWKPFHITWFEILDDKQEVCQTSSWKSGPLYGSKKVLRIRETAFTLAILPHIGPNDDWDEARAFPSNYDPSTVQKEGTDFWTILLLTPSQMSETEIGRDSPATYILLLIKQGLEKAADAWEEIRGHFSLILDDQYTILDPQGHDELLFDDDTFSRSRLYFWAMDSLDMFITQIKGTISEWKDFWDARQQMIRSFEEAHWQRTYPLLKNRALFGPPAKFMPSNVHFQQVTDQVSRLEDYEVQFEQFRAKTVALREGLFNASSVIESRAATRLGENVRLLTYVSIFYLPLAFCAGLWSLDESYDTSAFAITSVAVAVGTYMFVGNLENIVRGVKAFYRSVKQPIVGRMAQDPEQKWAERGEGFRSFQPDRKIVKPSEWFVVLFWGLEILRSLRVVTDGSPASGMGSIPENSESEDSMTRGESGDESQAADSESEGSDAGVDTIRQPQEKQKERTSIVRSTSSLRNEDHTSHLAHANIQEHHSEVAGPSVKLVDKVRAFIKMHRNPEGGKDDPEK